MTPGKDHTAISVGQSFWLGCWAGGWTEHKPPSPHLAWETGIAQTCFLVPFFFLCSLFYVLAAALRKPAFWDPSPEPFTLSFGFLRLSCPLQTTRLDILSAC